MAQGVASSTVLNTPAVTATASLAVTANTATTTAIVPAPTPAAAPPAGKENSPTRGGDVYVQVQTARQDEPLQCTALKTTAAGQGEGKKADVVGAAE